MSANPFSLAGKTAIVTGGNVGLGPSHRARAGRSGRGYRLHQPPPGEETGAQVKALGRKFISIEADLSSTAPIAGIVERTSREFGKIDILVNNAGIIRRNDSVDFTEDDWDAVIDTNLKSAFFLAQGVGRHMIGQGRGKIINIASMLSFQGGIRVPSYTASKSGLAGITKLLACEWAGKGVNVNAIAPGYMSTDNTEALRADPKAQRANP
jgi:2-deoxy-D-gluconate 3-dehydrogenase